MTVYNYAQIAGAVYQSCTTYDQYLPQLSADVARSWAKVFAYYHLGPEDLLAGVDRVYCDKGSGYRPLPADIAKAARTIREERAQREGPLELEVREQVIDARVADAVAKLAATKDLPADVKFQRPEFNPLLALCPHCKAQRYAPCTSHDGIPLRREPRYHQGRVDAVKAAVT
jgi:hypothetical protein